MSTVSRSIHWCASLLLLLPSAAAFAHDPAEEMAAAAERLLNSLGEEQRTAAQYPLTDEERQNWHFVPDKFIQPGGKRYGLPLSKMSPDQQALVHGLVGTALSHQGYLTAMTIVSLERVLHELEGKNPIRDPQLYYLTVFGTPGDKQAWAWRFEGHHLSVNVTIVEGKLFSVTPSFFGANPAEVKAGPQRGLRTLRDEEDLGRALATSLGDAQRTAAFLSAEAPADIITRDERRVDRGAFTPPQGVAASALDNEQRALLLRLMRTFAEKFRPELVEQIHARTKLFELDDVYFAWAGGWERGQGHYYRVQTPRFLFEYDNTQNDANHVHAVWRDFDGDFGADLLREHYDADHAK